MNLDGIDLGAAARDVLARRGLDPADAPDRPFVLADHMVEQAEKTLALLLPARFRTAVADDPAVLAWVDGYLTNPSGTTGLLLRGPVGTGKTHQAYGALRAVALGVARRCRRMAYAVTSHPDFNAAMRPQPDGSHHTALADFQTADLLVLDDLGAGKATEWTEDTLYRLVDMRWRNELPTIVTTNLDAARFRGEMDERVLSRLATCTQVVLKGGDRRREVRP